MKTEMESKDFWVDPISDPDAAKADISKILETTSPDGIEFPPDDLVTLPGGLIKNGKVIKTAIVKELTGEDEETLSRASQSKNPFHFVDRLLRCGTVQIGKDPASEELLKSLLVGDREHLILEIRRATYGEEIELTDWRCNFCGITATLTMQLDDIPFSELKNITNENTFSVALKRGGTAKVRLATGDDQEAIFEKDDLLTAERETILLSRCIDTISDKAGNVSSVVAQPSLARNLGLVDRHKILEELRKRQPGPKYDSVKHTCSCGKENTVVLGISDLFLDFRWI